MSDFVRHYYRDVPGSHYCAKSTRKGSSQSADAVLRDHKAPDGLDGALVAMRSAMNITRAGSQPSGKGPADWFTGTVRLDPLIQTREPSRVAGATVTFELGARTAWHTHPLGQTLIVLSGRGLVQRWDGPIEEIHPGDVVWFD